MGFWVRPSQPLAEPELFLPHLGFSLCLGESRPYATSFKMHFFCLVFPDSCVGTKFSPKFVESVIIFFLFFHLSISTFLA